MQSQQVDNEEGQSIDLVSMRGVLTIPDQARLAEQATDSAPEIHKLLSQYEKKVNELKAQLDREIQARVRIFQDQVISMKADLAQQFIGSEALTPRPELICIRCRREGRRVTFNTLDELRDHLVATNHFQMPASIDKALRTFKGPLLRTLDFCVKPKTVEEIDAALNGECSNLSGLLEAAELAQLLSSFSASRVRYYATTSEGLRHSNRLHAGEEERQARKFQSNVAGVFAVRRAILQFCKDAPRSRDEILYFARVSRSDFNSQCRKLIRDGLLKRVTGRVTLFAITEAGRNFLEKDRPGEASTERCFNQDGSTA